MMKSNSLCTPTQCRARRVVSHQWRRRYFSHRNEGDEGGSSGPRLANEQRFGWDVCLKQRQPPVLRRREVVKEVTDFYRAKEKGYISRKDNALDTPLSFALQLWVQHCLAMSFFRVFPIQVYSGNTTALKIRTFINLTYLPQTPRYGLGVQRMYTMTNANAGVCRRHFYGHQQRLPAIQQTSCPSDPRVLRRTSVLRCRPAFVRLVFFRSAATQPRNAN